MIESCLCTSFQATNKTSGKCSLVQKPSAQKRGFKKKKREKRHLSRPDPRCTCWQTKSLLCLTRIIFKTDKGWMGKCRATVSIIKTQRENSFQWGNLRIFCFHRTPIFSQMFLLYTNQVGDKNIPHAPLTHTQQTSLESCIHSHRHCLMSHPNANKNCRSTDQGS